MSASANRAAAASTSSIVTRDMAGRFTPGREKDSVAEPRFTSPRRVP
jgi:hypothetical protein